jgi:hypothetical protein
MHHGRWKINAEIITNGHSGGRGSRRVEYGRSYVVRPKGRHLATIVWLHGLGDNGARYYFLNFAYSGDDPSGFDPWIDLMHLGSLNWIPEFLAKFNKS